MTEEFVINLFRESFYTMFIVAGPILLTSLVIGLFISVLQAATSIQEVTLTFVPKMAAIAIILVIFLPWMMDVMKSFTVELMLKIPELAR
jgi:flagellar biosynthetic protein FliQ